MCFKVFTAHFTTLKRKSSLSRNDPYPKNCSLFLKKYLPLPATQLKIGLRRIKIKTILPHKDTAYPESSILNSKARKKSCIRRHNFFSWCGRRESNSHRMLGRHIY